MNNGNVQFPSGEQKPHRSDKNLPESPVGEQRVSGGGELPKMNIGEKIIYYVLFGWAWGFEALWEKRHLIKEIGNDSIAPLIKNPKSNK